MELRCYAARAPNTPVGIPFAVELVVMTNLRSWVSQQFADYAIADGLLNADRCWIEQH